MKEVDKEIYLALKPISSIKTLGTLPSIGAIEKELDRLVYD